MCELLSLSLMYNKYIATKLVKKIKYNKKKITHLHV